MPHAIFVQCLGKGVAGVQDFHLLELTPTAVPRSSPGSIAMEGGRGDSTEYLQRNRANGKKKIV